MAHAGLLENEKAALLKLKSALLQKLGLLDFRVYGSKARGDATPDSDVDVMIEVENYTPAVESEIDELIFQVNLEFECFISAVIFSRRELEEGPLDESPLYKMIEREGVRV
jgi:predicted nucleotidyltransferase